MKRARRGREPLPLTDEQRAVISTMNIRQASRHLRMGRRRVRQFRSELGLDEPKNGRPLWTPTEEQIRLMSSHSLEELEEQFNVSVRTLRNAISRLGIERKTKDEPENVP